MTKMLHRFFSKVKKTESCWNWKGGVNNGYCIFSVNTKPYMASRFAYNFIVRQLTNDEKLKRTCDNKYCVNPEHHAVVPKILDRKIIRLRAVWNDMLFRCNNKKCKSYHNYGGRGIKVCERWEKFDNFMEDMGFPKSGQSLDRIDNNKGYSKENCRWISMKENLRNRRTNHLVKINGEEKTIAEWAEISGLSFSCLSTRIKSPYIKSKDYLKPSGFLKGTNQFQRIEK